MCVYVYLYMCMYGSVYMYNLCLCGKVVLVLCVYVSVFLCLMFIYMGIYLFVGYACVTEYV